MAINPESEFIWRGRLHIGDEPGVHGDAAYVGLCCELPITLFRSRPGTDDIEFTLIINSEDVTTYDPYPGHEIIVFAHEANPPGGSQFKPRELGRAWLQSADNNRKEIKLKSGTGAGSLFISVRLRVDTFVPPGLYDDFLWTGLFLSAPDHALYAAFGFQRA